MELKLSLTGILDEVHGNYSAIPYFLKLYLKEIEKLPIEIDPLNPGAIDIKTASGLLKYNYHVTDHDFYVHVNYTPDV